MFWFSQSQHLASPDRIRSLLYHAYCLVAFPWVCTLRPLYLSSARAEGLSCGIVCQVDSCRRAWSDTQPYPGSAVPPVCAPLVPGTQCRHPGLARAVSSPSPWQAAAWIPATGGVRRRPWPVLLDSQGGSLTMLYYLALGPLFGHPDLCASRATCWLMPVPYCLPLVASLWPS